MEHVWYAAYGSNLSRSRFLHYLSGGRPPGASRTYAGARDPREPLGDVPVTLDGQVYFAWESPTWGGGIAFYDRETPGSAAGRAYLLTVEQFSDVASQEMRRPVGRNLPLADLFRESRTAVLGPGRYETLHVVGEIDGVPLVTFTASWAHREVELTPPVAAYLRTIATGLTESHGWGLEQVCDYLAARPGVSGAWSQQTLAEVLAATPSPRGDDAV